MRGVTTLADDNTPRELTEAEKIRLKVSRGALNDALSGEYAGEPAYAAFAQFLQTSCALRRIGHDNDG